MKKYLQIVAIILLHAAAILGAVSANLNADGVNQDADPMAAIALAAVAFVMLKASKIWNS